MRLYKQKHSRSQLWSFANRFLSLRETEDLSHFFGLKKQSLKYVTETPSYRTFEMPKSGGRYRTIEHPEPTLKRIQKQIGFYLQANYYFVRTAAAYGFVTSAKNTKSVYNIKSNALKHRNAKWMLNVDFEDFFHQISKSQVVSIFRSFPFNFGEDLAFSLAKLTTFNDRLPMGASTSPILSNYACRALDHDLLQMGKLQNISYTRFADDLTFSSSNEIGKYETQLIKSTCHSHGFILNPNKEKLFTPNDIKEVTGLLLTPTGLSLKPYFVHDLKAEIQKFKSACEIKYRMGQTRDDWIRTFERQIKGAIAYVGYILGRDNESYQDLLRDLDRSQNEHDPTSWLDFGYKI